MPENLAEWIGIALAAIVGGIGWIVASVANSKADKANELAEQANNIAASAVKEAERANSIAREANELSEDSNSVVKRQAAQQNEDWYVKWKPKWDPKSAMLILTNEGRDAAKEISCVVVSDGLHEIGRPGEDVPPGEDFLMHLPQITERRNLHAREVSDTLRRNEGSSVFVFPSNFHVTIAVTIIWKTGLGATQDQVFEQRVS